METKTKESAIDEIIRFQTDRELHLKTFDVYNENTNILEELLESHAYDIAKENRQMLKKHWTLFITLMENLNVAKRELVVSDENRVDAYADIIVFAIGALLKLGYNPEIALQEVAKEINSREGQMIDGKFEKDLSDEAKDKWYKADYSKAKYNKLDS